MRDLRGLHPAPQATSLDGAPTASLSVALCTYQGARFLPQQLDSIAAQTRIPDELVVCDDGSTDATLRLIAEFAAVAPFPVRVHEHVGAPLGPARNFERALRLASGDVIALCDQDDVWPAQRLERTMQLFDEHRDAIAVFSDADLIDENGQTLGETLWQALGITVALQRRFSHGHAAQRVAVLCIGNVVTGATLAVRRTTLDWALPVPEGWLHDYWLAIALAAVGEIVMWPEPLCRYRVHPAQHTGIGTRRPPRWYLAQRRTQVTRRLRKNERRELADQAHGLALILDRLATLERAAPDPEVLTFLRSRVEHFTTRASFGDGHRHVGLVARELVRGRYHRHSSGLSSVAKDLLLRDVARTESPLTSSA